MWAPTSVSQIPLSPFSLLPQQIPLSKTAVAAVLTLVEHCPGEDLVLDWPQESIPDQAHPQRTA